MLLGKIEGSHPIAVQQQPVTSHPIDKHGPVLGMLAPHDCAALQHVPRSSIGKHPVAISGSRQERGASQLVHQLALGHAQIELLLALDDEDVAQPQQVVRAQQVS